MTIVWSQKAGETFQHNIDYLKDNWSQAEADKFVARVFHYLEILSIEPFIARKTYKTKYTCIGVIIPHISVVFRVNGKKRAGNRNLHR